MARLEQVIRWQLDVYQRLGHHPLGFWATVAVMLRMSLGMLHSFKRRGWIRSALAPTAPSPPVGNRTLGRTLSGLCATDFPSY